MKKRHKLLSFLFVVLATYHLCNIVSLSFLSSLKPESPLAPVKGEISSDIPWTHIRAFDSSIKFLRGLGYLVRYWLGQEQYLLAKGPDYPYLYLYDRRENPFLYKETADEVDRLTRPRLKSWINNLEEKGVSVAVLPIPPKMSLDRHLITSKNAPEELYRVLPKNRIEDPAGNYRRLVDIDPERFVDLFSVYFNYRIKKPDHYLYIPWDLHWTSEGVALSAKTVMDHFVQRGLAHGNYKVQFEGLAPLNHAHRLLAALQLPEFYLKTAPNLQWREPLYKMVSDETQSEKSVGRLITLGSSFCGRFVGTDYQFGKMLAKAMNRELVDACLEGGANTGGLRKLSEEGFHFRKGDIVVYEVLLPLYYDDPKDPVALPVDN